MKRRLVLKLGGELLEQPEDLEHVARGIALLATRASLVVVHGGGREIDAALATAGIPKQQIDGLRVTDARTLDVVVAVLAGAVNTRLVAALRRAGARPVGLTGADTAVVTVRRAAPVASVAGARVDLGLVGSPMNNGAPRLLTDLLARSYVPIVACVGATGAGQLLNINADTLASHLAAQLGAKRLVIAGGTAGVLDGRRTDDRAADLPCGGASDPGGHGEQGHGNQARSLPLGAPQRRRRRADRQRPRRAHRGFGQHQGAAGGLHAGGAMTATLDDIRERESRHVLQTYGAAAGRVRPRRRLAAVRRRRP